MPVFYELSNNCMPNVIHVQIIYVTVKITSENALTKMWPFIQATKLLSAISHHTKTCNRTILGSSRKKTGEKTFLIVKAHRNEYPCIIEMLWKYYYPDEPTVSSLGLGQNYNPIFDQEALRYLTEGYSFVAKCRHTGDIVGACINTSACPWDPDQLDKVARTMKDAKLRQLYHFYAHIQRTPLLWQQYHTNKIFEMNMVFVRSGDRKKGVCEKLLDASRQFGADCGYRVIRCDATNFYTGKICEKLKMKKVHNIPYCSYTGLDPADAPLINAPPPHTGVSVYVDLPFSQFK
ncbi:hypothetical protein PPYR_06190 [Photinus pyralis]|uniref:aralkylamine N-acetyltransferase n=2 Tax=Photinus pyralis TaxID=7054 RepID=A0A5N4AT93_PHOPY|nr:uncharacterized protein LOC116167360 [Photinus pyralis]KAB0800450.1 hypothetical protein PPYR_06190 [Photinus pyralis]